MAAARPSTCNCQPVCNVCIHGARPPYRRQPLSMTINILVIPITYSLHNHTPFAAAAMSSSVSCSPHPHDHTNGSSTESAIIAISTSWWAHPPVLLLPMPSTPGAVTRPYRDAAWHVSTMSSSSRKRPLLCMLPKAAATSWDVSSSLSWNLRKSSPPWPVRYTCKVGLWGCGCPAWSAWVDVCRQAGSHFCRHIIASGLCMCMNIAKHPPDSHSSMSASRSSQMLADVEHKIGRNVNHCSFGQWQHSVDACPANAGVVPSRRSVFRAGQ